MKILEILTQEKPEITPE